MSLVTLDAAKVHLKVELDAHEEDDLIQRDINAAELSAAKYLNRALFADVDARAAAIAAVPAALAAAAADYAAASAAADMIADDVARALAQAAAADEYTAAQVKARTTYAGMVIHDDILSAILLVVAHLYANREATTEKRLVELPSGVQTLLHPDKVYP